MDYRIELYDLFGRRAATYDQVPLMELARGVPGRRDRIAGLLPREADAIGPGWRVRAYAGGTLFCEGRVTAASREWSDARKLILDRYVRFHEVVAFQAESDAYAFDGPVARAYLNRPIGDIVRDAINRTPGPVHYTVAHAGYPGGAEREFAKLEARMTPDNALAVGDIDAGQWVGPGRIDASGAFAIDGDTIGGLVVDGTAWPPVRLMMVDAEETSRNSHAVTRHPEVAFWTDAEYNASAYKRQADAAADYLAGLIATRGIDYIELNPHRDASGAFDGRVDAGGRYLGLVYGGGQCFNAALVEAGHSAPHLDDDGQYLDPALALKDFFSYAGENTDSIADAPAVLGAFDADQPLFAVLTALAYAAGGYVWHVDATGAVTFRPGHTVDGVVYHDALDHGMRYGGELPVASTLHFTGHPASGPIEMSRTDGAGAGAYGERAAHLAHYSLTQPGDADRLCRGLLDDLAWPGVDGAVEWYRGHASIRPGDLIELRGERLHRLHPRVDGEWGGRFEGRLVGRVAEVVHRLRGRRVATEARLMAPLRSVDDPLAAVTRGQLSKTRLYEFRLDDDGVGLDLGYHLG